MRGKERWRSSDKERMRGGCMSEGFGGKGKKGWGSCRI